MVRIPLGYIPNNFFRELDGWLGKASHLPRPARAVICPHAGYRYSGPTAAYSFKQIDPNTVR